MTLKQFRYRVSRQFDFSPANGDDRDLIDSWLYDGILDFSRRTKMNHQLTTMALTVDEGDYELSQDVLAFTDVWVDPATAGSQSKLLVRVDSTEIQRLRNIEATAVPEVDLYAVQGENIIMIYPDAASSSDVLNVMYVPKPSQMTDQDDSPADASFGNIPAEFHPTLEQYVKAQAADFRGDPKAASLYLQLYNQRVADAKSATSRKGGMRLSGARWGKDFITIPTSPGVDLG